MKTRRWIVGLIAGAIYYGTWRGITRLFQAGARLISPSDSAAQWGKSVGGFVGFIVGIILCETFLERANRKEQSRTPEGER